MASTHTAPAERIAEHLAALRTQGQFVSAIKVDDGVAVMETHNVFDDGAPPRISDKDVLSAAGVKPGPKHPTPKSKAAD